MSQFKLVVHQEEPQGWGKHVATVDSCWFLASPCHVQKACYAQVACTSLSPTKDLLLATHFLMPIFSSYLRFSDCRYRIMRMAQGTTTVTMLAHQPGVETSKAVVIEVCSSSASGTAVRAVLRRELVDTGRPPNTKD